MSCWQCCKEPTLLVATDQDHRAVVPFSGHPAFVLLHYDSLPIPHSFEVARTCRGVGPF